MEKAGPLLDPSNLAKALHAVGLRCTRPRLAVLHLLQHDISHPTAEQVYRRLRPTQPSLSLATVYNTLEAFTCRGLCRRVPPFDGRQRFDGTLKPHHHALCTRCGGIFDVPPEVYEPPPPPPRLGAGVPVRGVQVTFEVLCTPCQVVAGDGDGSSYDSKAQPTHTKEV